MFTKTAIILAAANLAAAHTTFQSFVIDGKDQGQHFAVQTPSNGNNPILDVTSTAMICNGGKATADQVEVAAGSKIGMQWHHNDPVTTGDGDEPIAASHKGPVMVYIAKADTNGEGAVWTKIWEDGLSGGKWGVDNFIANKGLVEVTLPDLEAGDYLIRPEMIGLHEASAEAKAQFYNGCGQIKVTGSGSASLPATGVDMTKAYKATDPGVLFNIYGGATEYTVPGPKVWDGASTGGSAPSTPSKPAASATPSPASSAAPSATPSPVEEAEPATPSATKPAATPAAPSSGSESGSALPETFTIEQFIQWLKTTTGSSASKARRHARAFHL
ncbi:unnamed protein product [Alternaria alternata]|jgi:cellulase|uniref:AA9 family lytic polysaccharide monooxygenase n=3 Tax=Alternaria sect. Alternaria TaxID=2499237 RepID=A0A177E1I0_ALTAL|nr:hypothetical protein CC77DRAFT_1028092 [Alternaria alternata]KAB2103242.1 hypothetical protein AG0111_0g7976 [Alternaria gaisen]RYN20973.1 hypothetical protein AA0115_g9932 [Alternaria tenuissima]KAH6841444.1 glycosyl hydrolase family 61-domain-containing protein [Alternaria alternata]KAH8624158.1 hypothetical protein IG631_20897 [Alternaria alternata]OAG25606.1 hypothetical protein CC77DRAFT_1028092 [Alternaria alternata]